MITVVTENDERTFNANGWTVDNDKTLTVGTPTAVVAEYSPGRWWYVLQAGSEVADPAPPSGDA